MQWTTVFSVDLRNGRELGLAGSDPQDRLRRSSSGPDRHEVGTIGRRWRSLIRDHDLTIQHPWRPEQSIEWCRDITRIYAVLVREWTGQLQWQLKRSEQRAHRSGNQDPHARERHRLIISRRGQTTLSLRRQADRQRKYGGHYGLDLLGLGRQCLWCGHGLFRVRFGAIVQSKGHVRCIDHSRLHRRHHYFDAD